MSETTGGESLVDRIEMRGISRLCHFTPSRNLVHIASGEGLFSTKQLSDSERAVFNEQDRQRLDGHPDHISCSIEYPNAWYFRQKTRNALGEAANFPDWVVVSIDANYLRAESTLFCQRNAAAGGGVYLEAGEEGFEAMFAAEVVGSGGRIYARTDQRPISCPTDDQAEVMVYRFIPLEDIRDIFVRDAEQAAREHARLKQVGATADHFRYVIAPSFFRPYELSSLLRSGTPPAEDEWNAGNANA